MCVMYKKGNWKWYFTLNAALWSQDNTTNNNIRFNDIIPADWGQELVY